MSMLEGCLFAIDRIHNWEVISNVIFALTLSRLLLLRRWLALRWCLLLSLLLVMMVRVRVMRGIVRVLVMRGYGIVLSIGVSVFSVVSMTIRIVWIVGRV